MVLLRPVPSWGQDYRSRYPRGYLNGSPGGVLALAGHRDLDLEGGVLDPVLLAQDPAGTVEHLLGIGPPQEVAATPRRTAWQHYGRQLHHSRSWTGGCFRG